MRLRFAMALIIGSWAVIGTPARAQQGGWTTYTDSRGTRVEYPANVFSIAGRSAPGGLGREYTTRDGRASLRIYSIANAKAQSPASYMRRFPAARSSLSYDRVA